MFSGGVKYSAEEPKESIFADSIMNDIPLDHQKLKKIQRKAKKRLLVVMIVAIVIVIAIICFLRWFFVFRNKADKKETMSYH
ncbi:hypothetical protein TVAG_375640 [Trichomonas vaginalis G3]|uniref:Uncharacterized protein n=1 Tax=Trichomonas vaginalis (strain ATCC PRA-98 / G3) TaxID=412133 RepID=A2FY40_TRIV3|nr:hypothetical protein TVAGG3_0645730 [Trichomonas vaginalis G3]EAX90173.1 hypothetical protein TVAG_375640 [Trichomonas vaginalis G3]KAI5505490.1 hypothetical protein TVAGG3_0645730 [Trichomonas vaginalis G3]|eukprot:XP_001303103.1 hypothetical protein [Trichomonas vaginalis G3]